MSLTKEEREAALKEALKNTQSAGVEAQAEAAQRVLMTQPSQPTADRMWLALTIGLLVLVGIALVAIVVLIVAGKYKDVALTVFTALLTGLLGLFVESPTKGQ